MPEHDTFQRDLPYEETTSRRLSTTTCKKTEFLIGHKRNTRNSALPHIAIGSFRSSKSPACGLDSLNNYLNLCTFLRRCYLALI